MKGLFVAWLFVLCAPARALDGVSLEGGAGSHDMSLVRVAAQWNQRIDWLAARRWELYWDASFGGWHGDAGTIYDLGLTPVFRYPASSRGWYGEAGIGLHYLSDKHIASDLDFSTNFQFGDHAGFGYRFADWELSARLQHLSNAGIRNPNPGINFLILRLQYLLR